MREAISVVICTYNEEKYIKDCIQSVLDQKTNFPVEIIVVNNNCTDRTLDIVRSFKGIIIINEERKGLAFARQKGLDTAKGEILVYIDADVRLPEGWLVEVKEYFDSHPAMVGLSTGFRYYDGKLTHVIGGAIFQYILIPIISVILQLIGKPGVLLGQSNALRASALKKAGGINLDFVFHGEDTSLAYRLHSQGKVQFVLNPKVMSSARRYIREGTFKTIHEYWMTFLLFTFGNYKNAKEFALRHNPK